jgi:hypothetical protein
MDNTSLVVLLVVSAISIICNIAAAHHQSGPATLAIPLQLAVLWFGFQWNGFIGAIVAFIIANLVAILLCHTIFKRSIANIQGTNR